ncbi:MAG: hypothetical protein DMG65_03735 [Candidatus Angelobacter sp. Gp1-AA117]|nr:MAG: hypothetical protein DMG65_03735 [Candidatus Angelobacter sp. Gp1-AA117]
MAQKPAILITGVSGQLGLRLLEFLPEFDVIGVDVHAPVTSARISVFEEVDLREERSCGQLLELLRSYRPEGIAHLGVSDQSLRGGAPDRTRMWHMNVAGTGRVLEAIAEHNRMLGGVHKFVFASSAAAYGPGSSKAVSEDAPLQAHTLPYALDARETDVAVQARVAALKCKTYILRPHFLAGPAVENHLIHTLRGVPTGTGKLADRLRRRNSRLPLVLPSRGNYLEHKLQVVHVDDLARLIACIFRRRQTDPQLTIMNVAGRGDPVTFQSAARIANCEIKRVIGRSGCRMAMRLLWNLGISDVPPETLAYLLEPSVLETARLRTFLGDDYKKVLRYTCEDALTETFASEPSGTFTAKDATDAKVARS